MLMDCASEQDGVELLPHHSCPNGVNYGEMVGNVAAVFLHRARNSGRGISLKQNVQFLFTGCLERL